jgi:diguanylate cyclase (GGDEF)-like protein/PAS domain S-box-containing protein
LFLEDSAEDAALALDELRRGGFETISRRVQTQEAMEAALAEKWDIILSDFEVPGFGALGALSLLKEKELDIPLIIVSDPLGDETAVRAIKAGADDLIPREAIGRLAPTVERELHEAQIRHERRQARRALRESEARFRALAEAAQDAILMVDDASNILFANSASERIFGSPTAAMIGQPLTLFIPDERGRARLSGPPANAAYEPSVAELVGRRAGGQEIPLEVSFGELQKQGRRFLTVIARDVSTRKTAEDALRHSEERFRIAAQSLVDLIYEWDIRAGTLTWFGNVDQILGYEPGEFPRTVRAWERIIHPEDRDRVLTAVRRHLDTDEPFFEEYRVVRRDGAMLHWTDSGRALRDASGRPVRWVGVATDVTQRRSTEIALRQSETRLRTLVNNAPVVLFALDRDGIITHSEGKGLEALGLKPRESVGSSVWQMFQDRTEIHDHLRRALGGETHTTTIKVGDLGFETLFAPYRSESGEIMGIIGVATDVTERLRAQEALQATETRYRVLFEHNLAGVYRTTLDGEILDCNDSFARIFGYATREEVLEHPAWDFYVSADDRKATLDRLKQWQMLSNYEMCLRRKDGSLVWVLENGSLVPDPKGELSVIEGTVIDITERKRAEEQVKHLAFHDVLTGLPNRLLFNDRLTMALANSVRRSQSLAVLFLDLDRFKVINDSLGHSVGDQLLHRVAERVQGCIREADTVARLGGDEFIVLVPGISGEEDAAKVAQKIVEAIRIPFVVDQRELFATTSIGVAIYPTDGEDVETLVRNADTAMYRAKDQGRDNYQLYTPAMNAKALERLHLENRLRQALTNAELVVYYQPLVDLRSGQIRGSEALLRWQHPEMGLIAPGEFIPLAEASGLIVPIGRWVLQTACEQIRVWHEMGYRDLSVAVNLSTRQFQQTDLVQQVAEALASSAIEASSLDLEITETNAMQNAEVSISTLWDLKKVGVSLSMDDFGTGYSSLNYLKRFPIDRIKIDRSFVQDVIDDPDDAAIATAVIAMAHSMKLGVVAEGVETEEQLAFLRQNHCDEMQGYLFSRPVPAREFEALLRRNRKPRRVGGRVRAGSG